MFPNITVLEIIHYSKHTYYCHVANETGNEPIDFIVVEKSGENYGVIFLKNAAKAG